MQSVWLGRYVLVCAVTVTVSRCVGDDDGAARDGRAKCSFRELSRGDKCAPPSSSVDATYRAGCRNKWGWVGALGR